MTKLGTVLRLPRWRAAVKPYAGPYGSERNVVGVSLVAGRPDQLVDRADTVYLVLDAPLAVWRWDGLIRAASDASASAVVISDAAELERPTRMLAQRLELPIYRQRTRTGMGLLAADAIALLTQPTLRSSQLCTDFSEAALRSGEEPSALLDKASELTGVPAWAWMPGEPEPLTTGLWGSASLPPPPAPVADNRLREVRIGTGSGLQLATALGRDILTVGLAPPTTERLEEAEMGALLRVLALALRASHTRRLLGIESIARASRDLLDEILTAGAQTSPALEQRAEQAGFPLAGWLVGFAVALGADVSQVQAAARLGESLQQHELHGVVVPRTDLLTGWLGLRRRPDPTARSSLARQLGAAVHAVDARPEVAVGVGRPSRGVEGLRLTLSEAREALDVAAALPEGSRFVTIDGLGISATVRSWTAAPGFRATARTRLAPLLDNPELLRTLHSYLDHALSVTSTAQSLEVHRNTVMTRIARVETLLGTNLADPDERLALHLAVRAVES